MDAQGEVKRQVIHHAEQKADKGSVVPNAKKGIGGTLATRKVQGRATNKDLSRLRSFRRRTVSKLFAHNVADSLHLGIHPSFFERFFVHVLTFVLNHLVFHLGGRPTKRG